MAARLMCKVGTPSRDFTRRDRGPKPWFADHYREGAEVTAAVPRTDERAAPLNSS
jgi:hypothetical protein